MSRDRRTTRREFLASGASGVAGAALLSACSPSRPPAAGNSGSAPLATRALGRTGLTLSVVSMGSAYEPGLVRAALDAGLTYIHTSGSYADQHHERMLNRVFRGRPRESFLVGSSPDLPYRVEPGRLSEDLGTSADPAAIEASLNGSLERLGLESIDIFYLASINQAGHGPARAVHQGLRGAEAQGQGALRRHRHTPQRAGGH
jgi:aryl-alcohol dehydrogenase-like predicted oxidoreductase